MESLARRAPPPPDRSSLVLHVDVDAFFAQCEELRNPALADVPVCVTQKHIVVTSNYHARALGVTKLHNLQDARRLLAGRSDAVFVSGEDTTPYRAVTKRLRSLLAKYGPTEPLGYDECWIDVTRRLKASSSSSDEGEHATKRARKEEPCWAEGTHVYTGDTFEHRVEGHSQHEQPPPLPPRPPETDEDILIARATHLASEVRAEVKRVLGLRCCCGIAHNKTISKIAASLHKPGQQTAVCASGASACIQRLGVMRRVCGVGASTEGGLVRHLGDSSVTTVRAAEPSKLARAVGDNARLAQRLWLLSYGVDKSTVDSKAIEAGPKTISVEDSFKPTELSQCERVLRVIAPDLLLRLAEHLEERGTWPTLLTVRWRSERLPDRKGVVASASASASPSRWTRGNVNLPWPREADARAIASRSTDAATVLVNRAMRALREAAATTTTDGGTGRLTALNLGASNFQATNAAPTASFATMGQSTTAAEAYAHREGRRGFGGHVAHVMSKTQERAAIESSSHPSPPAKERTKQQQELDANLAADGWGDSDDDNERLGDCLL